LRLSNVTFLPFVIILFEKFEISPGQAQVLVYNATAGEFSKWE
jgi:hypothetical protein